VRGGHRRRIAGRLAEAGAHVLLTDVDEQGRATADALVARGLAASFTGCDVTDTDELRAAAEAGADGRSLDIWVNNAGIYPTTGSILDVADDFLARMLEVNVRPSSRRRGRPPAGCPPAGRS
jgi:NAD(P)-dependent dehydrogenase (short-subunit alcohol dehydrogenase family)